MIALAVLAAAAATVLPGKIDVPLARGAKVVPCPAWVERAREGERGSQLVCVSGTARPMRTHQREQDHYTRAIVAAGWKDKGGLAHVIRYARSCERLSLAGLPVEEPRDARPPRAVVWGFVLDRTGCLEGGDKPAR